MLRPAWRVDDRVRYGRLGADRRRDSVTGRLLIVSAAVLVVVVAAAVWLAGGSGPEPAPAPSTATTTGPSTATKPYVLPVADGVHLKSLLTVEDHGAASNGYELTGLPDGLGAFPDGANEFTLFMNHEFDAGRGSVRRHGQRGAYVSTFRIDRATSRSRRRGQIDAGVQYWNYVTRGVSGGGLDGRDESAPAGRPVPRPGQPAPASPFRDAERPAAVREPERGRGYRAGSTSPTRRATPTAACSACCPTATAQQLPRLGLFARENTEARLQQLRHHFGGRHRGHPLRAAARLRRHQAG